MRRGDFESLERRYLDHELEPRGFRLTPQPPAEWNDEHPSAVHEARPAEFKERYPRLRYDALEPDWCVDLWVQLDPTTGNITGSLNGPSADTVMARLGLSEEAESIRAPTDLGLQLTRLARQIAAILDAASQG